jgi:hypothetical protein
MIYKLDLASSPVYLPSAGAGPELGSVKSSILPTIGYFTPNLSAHYGKREIKGKKKTKESVLKHQPIEEQNMRKAPTDFNVEFRHVSQT